MICRVCGAHLAPEEQERLTESVPFGEREWEQCVGLLCPLCGSEAVSDTADCAECGGEFAKEELEDGLCRLCAVSLTESLDWMWEQLSPAQKAWAVANTAWMER